MVSIIIVAAGSGTRMGSHVANKVLLPLGDKPVLIHSLVTFSQQPWVDEIVVVVPAKEFERFQHVIQSEGMAKIGAIVVGGNSRQESVFQGLEATSKQSDWVFIHDGARPLITAATIERVYQAVREFDAVGVGVPVKDTIKVIEGSGFIAGTPDRSSLWAVQTPQAFAYSMIMNAYQQAQAQGWESTDDCGLLEKLGVSVKLIEGDYSNIKITTPEDIPLAEAMLGGGNREMSGPFVGMGYDVHQLVAGIPLILGGVSIKHTHGLKGHSDADVAVHALMDALLGAAGLGDIGYHFPDTDPSYRGISSLVLLERVVAKLREFDHSIQNVDLTIIAEQPKLAPYIPQMRENFAHTLGIQTQRVNIKATTTEQLGFTGRGEGIAAHAVATLYTASAR